MKILVACEESQEVCKAFRAKGHEAYSCDIIDPSGGHPEWHIKGDVLPLLNGDCTFQTLDTHTHNCRTMGYDNRFSTVYRPCGERSEMVSRKAEGLPSAEICSVLHALCFGTLRQDCRRESNRHYV